ncbi:MAG TPA: glycine C-acetyltransferase [Ktedonobacteraceae bacterium]|jgi:glycine C-acetyltransferase|nr:glycine C-acetyltransferase [Ktedonobacteraceae bacterium]
MDKLQTFLTNELNALREKGVFSLPRELQSEQKATVTIDGREVITLSSNNYLGLTVHPRLREAAVKAIEEYGVGSGSVRTIAGTMTLHNELERRLARFKHTEASLTIQSGYATNLGVISALMQEGDMIISDELNHASIIDGIRLCKAPRKIYPHKDMAGLRKVLEESKGANKVMVVTDGVFSMDGDIAPLPEIVELAEEYSAFVMVDDAHASGVLGKNGRGTVNHFGLDGRVALQIGTLSKGIGALGGYVACSQDMRDYLLQRARPVLFSTSHPPSVVATCIAALDLLENDNSLVERLWENTHFFKRGLEQLGFNTGKSETPITPVIVGEGARAMQLSRRLFEEGVFAQGIVYPTVPADKCRVRTIVTAIHTREELSKALDAFEKVGRELHII